MKNYKELRVWQHGIELVKITYELVRQLLREETYGLRSQMTRAAVSIPSNIAEGSSGTSELEYRHFLEIALGSCFELDTQLIVAVATGLSTACGLPAAQSFRRRNQNVTRLYWSFILYPKS